MEQTPQQDLTIGQAHGGYWKKSIEQHNLVARQVLTPEEAGIDDSEETMPLDELEAAEKERQRQFYRDLGDNFDEDTALGAAQRTVGTAYYTQVIQQKEISFNAPRIVWHQTGHQSAKAIRAGGFKSGSEVGLAEKRGGVYFADLDVNPQLYSRTAEGEAHAGQSPDAIPLNLQGLRLLNLSYEPAPKNWPLHKEFGAKMIRGEFDTLPEGIDGAIQFLDDGRIYEVALPPSTANRQRSVTPTAIAATRRS